MNDQLTNSQKIENLCREPYFQELMHGLYGNYWNMLSQKDSSFKSLTFENQVCEAVRHICRVDSFEDLNEETSKQFVRINIEYQNYLKLKEREREMSENNAE